MVGNSLVSVIDDDVSVREALPDLLRELGYTVEAFASAEAFLASETKNYTDCLLLDIAMPGMSGPDLRGVLARQGRSIPIIYITGDVPARAATVEDGVVECLYKPFSDSALMRALNAAIDGNRTVN
jgi:FixJ family two-component response regulator